MAESTREPEQEKLDLIPLLSGIWRQIRRTWWLGVLFVIVAVTVGILYAHMHYTPRYEAKASFVVSTSDSTSISTSRYYNTVSTEQLAATFPYILTSGALSKVVANDLGLSSVPGTITASVLGETNLFQISVVASDPQTAYDILESVVENYPTVAKYVIGNTSLKLLEESGVPTSPKNSYNYKGYVLRFVALSVVLYLAILFCLTISRRTVHSRDELQRYVNAPYLGGMPLVRGRRRSKGDKTGTFAGLSERASEGYLEAMDDLQIRFSRTMEKRGWKTVLVTSALAGEGKTSVACNLALHLADKGMKVLLIDCDLRSPSVAATLGFPQWGEEDGLADYLKGRQDDPTDLLHTVKGKPLYVLAGGRATTHTAPLYSNGRLQELVEAYREKVDYVIVDTPPCTFMHDTALISPCLEAGLLVVRQDCAPVNRIMAATEILAQAELPLAGCVLNGIPNGHGHYGYGYGYGFGYGYGYGHYGSYGAKK
ncbi:MAG: polysaccharide biosynthesis tyrosine autokinase [Clostridiales bacterium]|nr:polysaccharide biosynthesis tyrosine autokinase [Clostridiales bacterium]